MDDLLSRQSLLLAGSYFLILKVPNCLQETLYILIIITVLVHFPELVNSLQPLLDLTIGLNTLVRDFNI